MYTKIPNHVFDILPELSGVEVKVIMAIYRHSAGWQRESATLSLSTLAKITGASIRQLSTAVTQLMQKDLVSVEDGAKGRTFIPKCGNNCNTETPAMEIISIQLLQKLPPYKERKESITTSDDVVQATMPVAIDEVPRKVKRKRQSSSKVESTAQAERTALTVFREIHRLHVPMAIRQKVLTDVTDLDRWQTVCTEWISRGYRPGNVDGCLRVYQEGWNERRTPRHTQRGDIQRQQREALLGQRIAEFEHEDSIGGDWGDS